MRTVGRVAPVVDVALPPGLGVALTAPRVVAVAPVGEPPGCHRDNCARARAEVPLRT